MLQTQKKVKRRIRTYTKEAAENRRRACIRYRKDISSGFNLLIKWVPGTETLIRGEILIETVNYIKKLQNELKEVKEESLKNKIKELKKESKRVKELQKKIKELETSQTAIDTVSASREPHSSPSEPEVVKTFASTPTGASMRKTSSTMDAAVQTTSEAESATPEEELPEEELLVSPDEELLASGIPEFNSMEDFRQWLEL